MDRRTSSPSAQPAEGAGPLPIASVAVVDDDEGFREAFCAAVAQAPDLRLVGAAGDARGARALLAGGPPAQVLVLDLGLPDGSGLDLIAEVRRCWPGCLVLVSTVFGDESHVLRSLTAGAVGYLLKDHDVPHLAAEIRVALGGGSPISPLIARQLLRRLLPAPPGDGEAAARLSPREQQVLELVAKGFSYEEIAGLMGVSRNTVLSFVRRAYAKLGVRSQIEAIHEARHLGLLP